MQAAKAFDPTAADVSFADALDMLVSGDRVAAAEALVRHCDDHDGAGPARVLRYSNLVTSGVPGFWERAHRLNEVDAHKHAGDWRFDAELAMTRQEQRRYDEARSLAEGVLRQEPTAGFGVHVLAHVNYETGEHRAGLVWLDSWQAGRTVLGYQSHLRWHAALHLLALGDLDEALTRYRVEIPATAVIDTGSLLWRSKLAGADVQRDAEAAAAAAAGIIETMPTPFLAFNACLALAATDDVEALGTMRGRARNDRRPGFSDLLAPIVQALTAMVEGRYGEAADELLAVTTDLPRLGGRNLQREVVEDTLVHALLASGRQQQAQTVIQARLERRPQALDYLLMLEHP